MSRNGSRRSLDRARAKFHRDMQALGERQSAEIARAFCFQLRADLTREQLLEVVRLNKTAAPGVCHSHDFTDANEPMARAFRAVLHREARPASDLDAALWSRAWDLAMSADFDPAQVTP